MNGASDDSALVWSETGKTELLKTVVMTVNETRSVSSDGQEGRYIVMDAPDWVIVIPDLGEKFLMVKQWRHGERALSVEFPGGVMEAGETPAEAAARELKEETGCEAGSLVHLGSMNPNPALMSNHVHVFLAEGLRKVSEQCLDSDEYLNCFPLGKSEALASLGTKEFPHALMTAAAALYLARERARQTAQAGASKQV